MANDVTQLPDSRSFQTLHGLTTLVSVGIMLYTKPHEASLGEHRLLREHAEYMFSMMLLCSDKTTCENIDLMYFSFA